MSIPGSSEDELGAALFPGKVRKKAVHNQVERRRKDKINNWIVEIGEMLPDADNVKRQSKNGILEKAVEYILYLKEANKKLMLGQCTEVQAEMISQFEKRVKDLEQQNKSYSRLLKKAGITPLTAMEEELWKPKNGKYPKNLSADQVSALQKNLNQNGFLNKDSGVPSVEANENANTTNCPPVTKENTIPVTTMSVESLKSKPINSVTNNVEKSKVTKVTPLTKTTVTKSNCKIGNSVSFPSVSRNNMVLTQALPTEPLMSTTQNISSVQRTRSSVTETTTTDLAVKNPLAGVNEVTAIVNTQQQPLIVINDQSIPIVQNMLTFQSKPIVFGNENSLPVLPQQFNTGCPAIEILNAGNNSIQKQNSCGTTAMCVNQNSTTTVQSNISLPVVINGTQISNNCATLVPGNGSLASNLVIRPQDPSGATFSFCSTQDGSQIIQHAGVLPNCAQPSQSTKTMIGVPNNASAMTNSVLPLISQTMAFNQSGQMITFGPGTLLAAPTPTGPIQTQHSWPQALLLPNGQIIPVVSQPSVVYSSNPQPINGGLIVTPNHQTQIQNCSMSPQISSGSVILSSPSPTSVTGTVINNSGSVVQNQNKSNGIQNERQSLKVNNANKPTSSMKVDTTSKTSRVNHQVVGKTTTKKRVPTTKSKPKEKAVSLKQGNKPAVSVKNIPETNITTKTPNSVAKTTASFEKRKTTATNSIKNLTQKAENTKSTPPSSVPVSKEVTRASKIICNPEASKTTTGTSTASNIADDTQANDILARATESIFNSNLTEVVSTVSSITSVTSGSSVPTTLPSPLGTQSSVPTNQGQKNDASTDKKDNQTNVNSKKQPEKRPNGEKTVDSSHEPSTKKLKHLPTKIPDLPIVDVAPQTTTENLYPNHGTEKDLSAIHSGTSPNSISENTRQTASLSSNTSTHGSEFPSNMVSNHGLHSGNQNFTPNTTHDNMDLGSFVSTEDNCATDQELPSLILSSLTDENETSAGVNGPSCNNTGLQYLSLSPPDHYNHEIPVKDTIRTSNQNSFDRLRNQANSSNATSISSVAQFCNNPPNHMQQLPRYTEPNNCGKTRSSIENQNMRQEEKKTNNNQTTSMSMPCVSSNSINNAIPNASANVNNLGPSKQPKSLTHLSVTNSFLTNQVTTLPIISSQAHLNSTPSVYSRCGQNSQQLDSRNRAFVHSSQNLLLPINESNSHNIISSSILTNNLPSNSCYSNSALINKDHSAIEQRLPNVPRNSMRQPQPSPFNVNIDRNISPPKSRTMLQNQNSSRTVVSSGVYPGISIYNDTSNNHLRFHNRTMVPTSSTIGTGNHSISNYSAEALIGLHNTSSSNNSQANIAFNTSLDAQCSQNLTTPTYSHSSSRPLLSYSAESLLQNQTHSERKKDPTKNLGNENSYTQHFNQLRSPRTTSTLMGQNATFSQSMFPPCSTFSSSLNPIVSSESNTISQMIPSVSNDNSGLQTTNYGTTNQQFGNHFGSNFLMRPLGPPHMPEVSNSTHRTNTQPPPFSIGCSINSNGNDFSQKPATENSLSTRNMNIPSDHASQNHHATQQQQNHHHQRSGCLFPTSSPQSIHQTSGLTMPDTHFPLLSGQNQPTHGSSKNDAMSMLNHYPQTQPQNHAINNFLPGQFVQGMTGNHNLNLGDSTTTNDSQISRVMPMDNGHNYIEANKKERTISSSNVTRNPGLNHSSKSQNKSGKNASKRKPTSEVQNSAPTVSIANYDKSHNIPYFSVPELSTHSELQPCSINRFFPGCQRTSVQTSVNHQQNRGTSLTHIGSQPTSHIPAISGTADISRNSPYNPLFRPQSQSSLNLNFQPPSFSMNPLQRVSTSSGCPTSTPSNSILSCQLSSNNVNNTSCTTATHHVPNFNLSNIFPDISAGTTPGDSLTNTLNPIKFHPTNSIIPHPPTHPSSTQGAVDISALSQGSGHHNRTGVTRPPPLYHNRPPHPPPPVIHNGFNSILGTGPHAFDRGSGQMVMGMSNNPASAPPHFGHTASHPPPFGNVLPTLNFPVHDTH